MAFPVAGTPPVTWQPAAWATGVTDPVATCLVGPAGTVTFRLGAYDVYLVTPPPCATTPREVAPRNATARDATARDVTARDVTARDTPTR